MVDIHCHILHSLDDGADTFETSLQMAEMAIADGITHVVATPHANSQHKFDPEIIRQRRDELQAAVGGRLKLATGCDFHMSFENLQDLEENPRKYTINQKNYLLVEFADFSIPPAMDGTMHHLHLAGLSPVITHPERNALLRTKPDRMYRWLHQGAYVQITAQSLLGRFGSAAQRRAEQWLDEDRVHFIASDAHNLKARPLQLRAAFEVVAERRGEEIANALFRDNPLAAFEGRSLSYEPEQADPDSKPSQYRKRKRFLFF
ncbi:MAG TPA: CpsB/CapC family capsule biosynthesis tyrosine phosphatase [Candidatus Acidoferrales bacterium]|nr:CpsB/CapC family capsule biosynthesis tyrosine phosphatase [Candidatus Acidoferrales bacterium]